MKALRAIALLWSATIPVLVTPAPAAESCDAVKAAEIKALHTPHKLTMTTMVGGEASVLMRITTGRTSYVRMSEGSWRARAYDAAQEEAGVIKRFASGAKVCTSKGQEMVGDQLADVYFEESPTLPAANKRRIWVSSSLGLPLKIEVEQRVTSPSVLVFDFKNVQPPAEASP